MGAKRLTATESAAKATQIESLAGKMPASKIATEVDLTMGQLQWIAAKHGISLAFFNRVHKKRTPALPRVRKPLQQHLERYIDILQGQGNRVIRPDPFRGQPARGDSPL